MSITVLLGLPNAALLSGASVSLTGGGAAAPFDDGQLADPSIHRRARTKSAKPIDCELTIDLGADFAARAVRTLSLINGNWEPDTTWLVMGSNAPLPAMVALTPNTFFGGSGGDIPDIDEGQAAAPDSAAMEVDAEDTLGYEFPTPGGTVPTEALRCAMWILAKKTGPGNGKVTMRVHDATHGLGNPIASKVIEVGTDYRSYTLPFTNDGLDLASVRLELETDVGGATINIEAVDWHWYPTPAGSPYVREFTGMGTVSAGPGGISTAELPPALNRTASVDLGTHHSDKRYWRVVIRHGSIADDFVTLGLANLSPAVQDAKLIEDNDFQSEPFGGEWLTTLGGADTVIPPVVRKRSATLALRASEEVGLREIAGSLLQSGALDRPFMVSLMPEALPGDQAILSFLAAIDPGSESVVRLLASSTGLPLEVRITVREIT